MGDDRLEAGAALMLLLKEGSGSLFAFGCLCIG